MGEFKFIFETTYSVVLPLLLAYIARQVSRFASQRDAHAEADARINEKLDNIARRQDEYEMRNARYRIIRFDDEENHGMHHSEDHYEQMMDDLDIYKTYCDAHPEFKNHRGQSAMQRILDRANRMCMNGGTTNEIK